MKMLYPQSNLCRSVLSLDGNWRFRIKEDQESYDPKDPLDNWQSVAVPASFNDQVADPTIRNHVGYFYYQRDFTLPKTLADQDIFLRFGSATHQAWVYVNDQEVAHHQGGFTPFECKITDAFSFSKTNRLTVLLSNILDHTTLPVGHYHEKKDDQGKIQRELDENFDFFNYAGLNRSIVIYTSSKAARLTDLTILPDLNDSLDQAKVSFDVSIDSQVNEGLSYQISIYDEAEKIVAVGKANENEFYLDQPHLWQPLNAYLYTAQVDLYQDDQLVDTYRQDFGIRKVEVKNGQFLINQEPFYFKGCGKHEDSYAHGRGFDPVYNVLDINLLKSMGANSIRTSHYPYSEEMMQLCDREGIVVIDETTGVGIMSSFGFNMSNFDPKTYRDNTFQELDTQAAHEQVIRELIQRDKNHACVVMWSLANEAATFNPEAHDYFAPLFELARSLDPQKRPLTMINILLATPDTDQCSDLVDVICLNRYYGWYTQTADFDLAEDLSLKELQDWQTLYPDKPIMYTEYGVDTVAGLHAIERQPFTEEFQWDYYVMMSRVFDQVDNFVGEQLWNFADFQTKVGVQRVQGNKKGIFNRAREPKMVVRFLKDRWQKIPNFNYKIKTN